MGSKKDHTSEGGDPEDIPSDFFDDFAKEDFMDGLSVIDSWADDDNSKRRIDAETLDSVEDLRELIEGKDEDDYKKERAARMKFNSKYKWHKDQNPPKEGTLNDYIKPGSRRDPSKTNEAIKRDKEVKVKQLLAKHLDDDLRPPGTELDDYYSDTHPAEKQPSPESKDGQPPPPRRQSREHHRQGKLSPSRHRRGPIRSPRREFVRRSPGYRIFRQASPPRKFRRFSPVRRSPPRRSPLRRSPHRRSPVRRSPHRSSHMYRSSPHRKPRSRSPLPFRRSPRRSPRRHDTFLYPQTRDTLADYHGNVQIQQSYPGSSGGYSNPSNYPTSTPGYSYPQGAPFGYVAPGYEYGSQQPPAMAQMPQPVPAPTLNPMAGAPASIQPSVVDSDLSGYAASQSNSVSTLSMNPAPPMVPHPSNTIATTTLNTLSHSKPFDALAQLVADGKLSEEDYLKLAPNKSLNSKMDTETRVMVLKRCNQALSKLTKLLLPKRLRLNNALIGQEPKYLVPQYCSPLKRQAAVEFQFTKNTGVTAQQNKQLVDSIISTIGLDKVVSRTKTKIAKNMKDAAVQTTKPYCDVCEVRESIQFYEAGTSIDPEHFSSSIHTQVVDQDLINSKSVFKPTGSAADSAPMSIAHMTPAQLVSQLAARAKTLKQTPDSMPATSSQYSRRNPDNYDNRGHYNNYSNYGNYRY